jgi:hypothetical protein
MVEHDLEMGDAPIQPVPHASALVDSDMDCDDGYIAGGYCIRDTVGEMEYFCDGGNKALSGGTWIGADKDTFVYDVAERR